MVSATLNTDAESWRTTTYVLLLISTAVFLLQRSSWAMFETVFEVCVFHLTALVCALIYLKIRGNTENQ
jgi:hypothetical protein